MDGNRDSPEEVTSAYRPLPNGSLEVSPPHQVTNVATHIRDASPPIQAPAQADLTNLGQVQHTVFGPTFNSASNGASTSAQVQNLQLYNQSRNVLASSHLSAEQNHHQSMTNTTSDPADSTRPFQAFTQAGSATVIRSQQPLQVNSFAELFVNLQATRHQQTEDSSPQNLLQVNPPALQLGPSTYQNGAQFEDPNEPYQPPLGPIQMDSMGTWQNTDQLLPLPPNTIIHQEVLEGTPLTDVHQINGFTVTDVYSMKYDFSLEVDFSSSSYVLRNFSLYCALLRRI